MGIRIPGIYVEVKGDYSALDEDMRKARAIVRNASSDMSNSMNNALAPKQVESSVNTLIRNLGHVQRTAKLTGSEFDNLGLDLGELQKHTGLSEKAFAKLQGRMLQQKATQQADRALKSIARSANLSANETALLRLKMGDASGAMRDFGRIGVSSLGAVHSRVFSLGTAIAGLGVGLGLTHAVNSFASMDRGLIGVQKTTNLTDKEIQKLGLNIQQITTELPLTTEELLGIAQAAGQLGVQGSSNILKFTRTVGMLGTATDLKGDEAATTLARLLNVTGETADEVDVLGSVIVALGNNMATTESEIAFMATEVGQATSTFGVSSAQAAALGATLRSLGVRAELGGSAVGRVFRAIDASIRSGGESLKYLEKMTGQTGEQLKRTFATNSTTVFKQFIEGLGTVINSGGSAASTLEKFGLKGEEILKVMPTLALRSDELGKALGIAAKEQENATALTQEALKAATSFSAQMTIVSNEVDIAAAAIGKELAPHIIEASRAFGDFVEGSSGDFADWAKKSAEGIESLAPLVHTVGDEAGYLFNAFTDMPVELQAAGVIPALLFGKKGIAYTLLALHAAESVFNMGQGLAAVQMGHMSWDDLSSMDGKELQTRLDQLKKNASNINKLKASQKKDLEIMSSEAHLSVGNSGIFGEDLAHLAESPFIGPKQVEKEIKHKAGSSVVDDEDKSTKKQLKTREKFNLEYNKLLRSPYDFEKGQIQKQKELWIDAGVDRIKAANWETISLEKLDKEQAEKREKVLDQFNQKFQLITLSKYEFEKNQIAAQYNVWIKAGADEVKAKKWANLELKKLEQKHTKDLSQEAAKQIKEEKETARKKLEASDDFFAGMYQGYLDLTEKAKTWAQRGIEIAGSFASSSKAALSDLGFDALTGQMKSFSSYWSTFWGGLARSISNHLADLAVTKGLDMLMGMGGGLFDMAGSFLSNVWHTGNMRLGADEVASILQEGEMVVPARQAEAIRQSVGSEGMSKSSFFDSVVDRVSVGNSSVFDNINNSQRDVYGHHMFNSAMSAGAAGLWNGFSNWQTVGQQADVMRGAGINVSQSAVDNLQWNSALGGLAGTMFTGFAGNMFGSFGNQMLGMNDEKYNLAGLEFSTANIGKILGAAAGLFIGGPMAPVLSGALSPVFSLGVSGLADMFNLRDDENLRDALEDKVGWLESHVMMSSFRDRITKNYEGNYNPLGLTEKPATGSYVLVNGKYIPVGPSLPYQQLALEIEAAYEAERRDPVSQVLSFAHAYGHEYTQGIMDGKGEGGQIDALSGAVKSDPGFFGYTTRQWAAKQSKTGFAYEDSYYTGDGRRVDIDSIFNPNSKAALGLGPGWEKTLGIVEKVLGYQFGDGLSGDRGGLDGLGGYGGYSGVSGNYDLSGFGHEFDSFSGSLGSDGSDSSDRSSGGTGSGNAGGASGSSGIGRRHGGDVKAGGKYVWQETGLPGEVFFPQTNGYVMNHEDSAQMINALKVLVNEQKIGTSSTSGSGDGPMLVTLNLDGQQLASALVAGLREQSKNGVQFVHKDMLIESRS
ncbi:phage tail tape measure protein [Maridesulfovibrio ferrireducens]|uniref:phage tail tape measure protein n=1 Tax=Maridesulfovibrio ferrireducens TaxID=246191 RepID=UPI001A1A62D2|nr:phage tail tape measure protein [Maridesulfovibrio ferrireducens]MBI9110300.1 phage tail tape measure protein [Maridesulfovibrio ferrireducens]